MARTQTRRLELLGLGLQSSCRSLLQLFLKIVSTFPVLHGGPSMQGWTPLHRSPLSPRSGMLVIAVHELQAWFALNYSLFSLVAKSSTTVEFNLFIYIIFIIIIMIICFVRNNIHIFNNYLSFLYFNYLIL